MTGLIVGIAFGIVLIATVLYAEYGGEIVTMTTKQSLLATMENAYEQTAEISIQDAPDIRVRLQVLAGELEKLYQEIKALEQQLFLQTSIGEEGKKNDASNKP